MSASHSVLGEKPRASSHHCVRRPSSLYLSTRTQRIFCLPSPSPLPSSHLGTDQLGANGEEKLGRNPGGRSYSGALGMADWVDTTLRLRPPSKFVKVIKHGAPYQRKVDLAQYRGYGELNAALGALFGLAGDFSVVYLDDADHLMLLLATDLPWWEFVSRCKRLRVLSPGEPI